MHRWDAEHAAGRRQSFEVAVSVDSIEEFLTFSVSSVADQPDQLPPSLGGRLVLSATDADAAWTVTDDELPGTVRFSRGAEEARRQWPAPPRTCCSGCTGGWSCRSGPAPTANRRRRWCSDSGR